MTCPHKNKILKCKQCETMCCSQCIQLEVHKCPKIGDRIQEQQDYLAKKLIKVVAPKIIPI